VGVTGPLVELPPPPHTLRAKAPNPTSVNPMNRLAEDGIPTLLFTAHAHGEQAISV
jgi:hypothetical protein